MKLRMDDGDGSACKISLIGTISSPQYGEMPPDPDEVVKLAGGKPVLLSLAEAEFVDSSGVGWLLQCDKRLRAAGAKMVVHSVPPAVQQVFSMLKLNRVLSLCADQAEAVARIQQQDEQQDEQ